MRVKLTHFLVSTVLILLLGLITEDSVFAQTYVHPGGIINQTDLDRMKAKVAAGEHPWIDGWNALIAEPRAQKTYVARPHSDIGDHRQIGSSDAHAAYYNALRWYVTGDTSYAECAVRICNAYSNTVNQVANSPLCHLPMQNIMQAAELLRVYPGWKAADIEKFKYMARTYFYPGCHDFLGSQCLKPSSWEAPAAAAMMGIGVFCDDSLIVKESIEYFKNGIYNGSLLHTVFLENGQIGEMGRDQPHASIGPASLAEMCQTAWNQGIDLYSFANNRLLAGYEYYCRFNLNHPTPWVTWNNCVNDNLLFLAPKGAYRIRQSPVYEMLYNHYAVTKGLSTPYLKAMVDLARPEMANDADFMGCGTLVYTLNAAASPYPAFPTPPIPTGLTATAGVSMVMLKWNRPDADVSQGYKVLRSTASGGGYTVLTTLKDNTGTSYIDTTAISGTSYYYVVQSYNQSGTSANSSQASARPVAFTPVLPAGWAYKDIGAVAASGNASFGAAATPTYTLRSSGKDIGSKADACGYLYSKISGDFTITARVLKVDWNLASISEKIGIVMRETLDPNAKEFGITLGEVGQRCAKYGSRGTTGGSSSWLNGDQFTDTSVWFKIQRAGNTFTAYQCTDGINWVLMGSLNVSMSTDYYVGFAAAGGTTGIDKTAPTFDNVVTVGGGVAPSAPASLTAMAINSSRIKLTWNTSLNTTSYTIKRSLATGGPYTVVASNIIDTTYADAGLTASTKYYYTIKSGNLAGESPDSAGTSVSTPALSLPTKPVGLTGIIGDNMVSLNWIASDGAPGSYKVKRATSAVGPFNLLKSVSTTAFIDSTALNGATYFYTVSAVNAVGEGPASDPDSLYMPAKIVGRLIGTGSGNSTRTIAAAVDGDLTTFYDANQAAGWVGYDLGADTSAMVERVSFAPRAGFASRMMGGAFQVSNSPDFSNAVLLYTIPSSPVENQLTFQYVSSPNNYHYRYVRYLSQNNGYGNTAEINFYGRLKLGRNIPPAPTGLIAAQVDGNVLLNWAATEFAVSYNVKRSNSSSGPYTTVASQIKSTSYTDQGVIAGSTYYYLVTATNTLGEGEPSVPVDIYVGNKLKGTIIGTAGSFSNNLANTKTSAMDNNLDTFFDGPQPSGAWVGIDLGLDTVAIVKRINFVPRASLPARMLGGVFQGANKADFSDAVNLSTVGSLPSVGLYTTYSISDTTRYRYVRYLSPDGGYCDVAEVNFFGNLFQKITNIPVAPTGLNAVQGRAKVILTWASTIDADSYNIKRATVGAGPYTIIDSVNTSTSYTDLAVVPDSTYFYVVTAVNRKGEGPAATPASILVRKRIVGSIIGTPGSFNNNPANTMTSAMDDNLNTYFDAPQSSGAWVGLDLGPDSVAIVKQINFVPRASLPARMVGGIFQGANKSDFSDAVNLYTVSSQPAVGVYASAVISDTTRYRYVRYLSPNSGFCDVAEVNFFGSVLPKVSSVPGAPATFTATQGGTKVVLNWASTVNADSYNIKRAVVNSGPYTTIAAAIASTSYVDAAVTPDSTYFYTVTAVNRKGEGPAVATANILVRKRIVGTIIGTSGSFNNNTANTKVAAMDDNLNTYFDAPQSGGAWVGLDLGPDSIAIVKQINFVPRASLPGRMVGGIFQGANKSDFSDAVNLFTVGSQPAVGVYASTVISDTTRYRYIRYLSPNSAFCNVAEVNFYGDVLPKASIIPAAPAGLTVIQGGVKAILNWAPTVNATSYKVRRATVGAGPYTTIASANTSTTYTDAAVSPDSTYFYTVNAVNGTTSGASSSPVNIAIKRRLTGSLIGTTGSYNNNVSTTKMAAMDDDLNTYFDAPQASGGWVGLDLGPDTVATVTQINYVPRPSSAQRMVGGIFQGANKADFSDAVNLYTVANAPSQGVYTSQVITNSTYFRYLRYISPNGGSCNIAELNFYGQIRQSQTINFKTINKKRLGDPDVTLAATTSSGLSLDFSSSDTTIATVINGKIHIKRIGTSTITATQAGNANYSAAAVSQMLTVVPLDLQVQYQDGDAGQLTNNIIRPYVKVVNADTVGIAYNELTMRYWFTAENYAGISTWIDYAQMGNSNVNMKYVALPHPRNGAFGYVEYSFVAAGNLGAGTNTGEIRSRYTNQDSGDLNEADDYSYQSSNGYMTNNHITLYRNGALIWGTEPNSLPEMPSFNISYQNQNQNTGGNTISTFLEINNTGNIPVAYGDITARYWFTKEGSQSLNYWIDYAKIGNSNVSGNFVSLGTPLTGADTYLELAVNAAKGTLYPLSTTGNIQYRISKSDWSNFNELNDYSYMVNDVMKENNHITLYYKGQLIYGIEPAAAGSGPMALKRAPLALVPQQSTANIEKVAVHQALSPNGDGINDVLIIEGLTAYPENKVMIMDRNGVKVFEAEGYDNSAKVFDGHSNINGIMQQAGTYYYSLEYLDGEKRVHKTGFIILKY